MTNLKEPYRRGLPWDDAIDVDHVVLVVRRPLRTGDVAGIVETHCPEKQKQQSS